MPDGRNVWPITRKKDYSKETNPEMIEMDGIVDKNVKAVIITMFDYLNENMNKVRREIEDIF